MKLVVLDDKAHDDDILIDLGMEFAVYNYCDDGYSGWGQCLCYREGKWYTNDMGHCSCYGPFDSFDLSKPFDTMEKAMEDLYGKDWSKSFDEDIEKIREEALRYLLTLNNKNIEEARDCRTCEYWILHDYLDKYDEFVIFCSIGQLNWKKCQGKHYKIPRH